MFRAEEDYIKQIYSQTIESGEKLVSTRDLSNTLGHSIQSVNEMIKKLVSKDLVEYIPYKGVKLTKMGQTESIRILRAHRVWEVFLTEKLGFNWDDVHEEAELLEHASSIRIINRLFEYLNEPKVCQHGNPIPNEDGTFKSGANKSLLDFTLPGVFIIERFFDEKDVIEFLNMNNLKINSTISIEYIDLRNEEILINGQIRKITKKIASSIFGQKIIEVNDEEN